MDWYEKYLSIYEKPFSEVPQDIIDKTHDQLVALQSDEPIWASAMVAWMKAAPSSPQHEATTACGMKSNS